MTESQAERANDRLLVQLQFRALEQMDAAVEALTRRVEGLSNESERLARESERLAREGERARAESARLEVQGRRSDEALSLARSQIAAFQKSRSVRLGTQLGLESGLISRLRGIRNRPPRGG